MYKVNFEFIKMCFHLFWILSEVKDLLVYDVYYFFFLCEHFLR